MSYIGNSPVLQISESKEDQIVTATTQSVFNTNGYLVGYITVYRNGVRLSADDFVATDGATVTLNAAANKDDLISFEYRTEITQGVKISEIKQEILVTNTAVSAYTLSSDPLPEYTNVYYNGLLLSQEDYSFNGRVMTMLFSLNLNDVITVIMKKGVDVSEYSVASEAREEFTVTANTQTDFITFNEITDGLTDVFVNGIKLSIDDFTVTESTKTITLADAAVSGDLVAVISKNNYITGPQITETRQEFTVTAALETSFTTSGRIVPSHTDVYLNGIRLNTADYSISGQTVTLTDAPNENDIVVVYSRTSLTDATKIGATGGGNDRVFWQNDTTITTSYSIPLNTNALSAGPITVANGVVITVPDGSTWTVV